MTMKDSQREARRRALEDGRAARQRRIEESDKLIEQACVLIARRDKRIGANDDERD